MPTVKLFVQDLHSADAQHRLETALNRISGVYAAVASCSDGCVEVDFEDDEVTIDEIVAAASTAGFEATPAG